MVYRSFGKKYFSTLWINGEMGLVRIVRFCPSLWTTMVIIGVEEIHPLCMCLMTVDLRLEIVMLNEIFVMDLVCVFMSQSVPALPILA